MRDNLVMTSAYALLYAITDWQGGAKQTLQGKRGGGGEEGESKTSSLRLS